MLVPLAPFQGRESPLNELSPERRLTKSFAAPEICVKLLLDEVYNILPLVPTSLLKSVMQERVAVSTYFTKKGTAETHSLRHYVG